MFCGTLFQRRGSADPFSRGEGGFFIARNKGNEKDGSGMRAEMPDAVDETVLELGSVEQYRRDRPVTRRSPRPKGLAMTVDGKIFWRQRHILPQMFTKL
jgi:hypothetical protein